jgi:hypothetical protein
VNYEAWNRYVLMAIGLFAVLLYIALMYSGFTGFVVRISRNGKSKQRLRSRAARKLRNGRV